MPLHWPNPRHSLAAALTLLVFCLAGCASSGSRADDEIGDPAAPPPENLEIGIPPQAEKVTEARGSVRHTATREGSIYLYDLTANRVVGQYFVQPGQEFIVSGGVGRATLGANELPISGLSANRWYVLYFYPAPQPRAAGDSSGTFRITPVEQQQQQE